MNPTNAPYRAADAPGYNKGGTETMERASTLTDKAGDLLERITSASKLAAQIEDRVIPPPPPAPEAAKGEPEPEHIAWILQAAITRAERLIDSLSRIGGAL